MKPYLPKLSHRPGCTCCNTKNLHGFNARKTDADRKAMRAGKKGVRRTHKDAIKESYESAD